MNKKLSRETIIDVVLKLIGDVQPVGSTQKDEERYENLEVMSEIFSQLFEQLSDIEYYNRNRVEGSMRIASEKARDIIINTIADYIYERGYRKVEVDLWYEEEINE